MGDHITDCDICGYQGVAAHFGNECLAMVVSQRDEARSEAARLTARLAAAEKESELRKKEAAHSKLGIWTENPGVMLWVEPRPFGFALVFRSGNEVVGEYAFAAFRRLRVSSAIDAALANAAGEGEAHD